MVRRRQMFAAIAADEGERNAARNERIGNMADRFAAKMGIEKRSIHRFAGNSLERIADIRRRADHSQARLFKDPGNVEGNEELVLDNENARCCHSPWHLSLSDIRKQVHWISGSRPTDRSIDGLNWEASASGTTQKGVNIFGQYG
jgi:hypothetical protein